MNTYHRKKSAAEKKLQDLLNSKEEDLKVSRNHALNSSRQLELFIIKTVLEHKIKY